MLYVVKFPAADQLGNQIGEVRVFQRNQGEPAHLAKEGNPEKMGSLFVDTGIDGDARKKVQKVVDQIGDKLEKSKQVQFTLDVNIAPIIQPNLLKIVSNNVEYGKYYRHIAIGNFHMF